MIEEEKIELKIVPEEEETQEEDYGSPLSHTILEIWKEVLSNIDKEAALDITPQSSIALLASWPHLKVQEHSAYSKLYYTILKEFQQVVLDIIEENPTALKNIEDDNTENHDLYIEILGNWQLIAREWEDEWDASKEDSHVYLAALADAINFVLSSQGLVAHLDEISLQITEEDQKIMQGIIDEEN